MNTPFSYGSLRQYLLLAGRSGGQIITGGINDNENLTIIATTGVALNRTLALLRKINGANKAAGFAAQLYNSNNAITEYAAFLGGIAVDTAGAEDGFIALFVTKTGIATQVVTIDKNGCIMLGTTTSPTSTSILLKLIGILQCSSITGSESSGGAITISSTNHSTKGKIQLGAAAGVRIDEPTNKFDKYNGVTVLGMGIVPIVDYQPLAPQGADISDTAFANASTVGLYRVMVYLVDSAADLTAGTVTCHIKFNDGSATQDVAVGPVVLTTLGTMVQATIVCRLGSGSITYGVTHTGIFGTATYTLYAICERLA